MGKKLEYVGAALLLALFVTLCLSSLSRKSATTDEFAHLPAGLYAWRTGNFELYNKTPPLARMIATSPALLFSADLDIPLPETSSWRPWIYATAFQKKTLPDYSAMLFSCRAVVVVFGAVLCLVVWRSARNRYGKIGGIASLSACALSPTLIAHSRLVTTDVPAALFSFLFMLAILSYWRRPALRYAGLAALMLAAASLTKFSGLFWAPFALVAPFAAAFKERRRKIDKPKLYVFAVHLAVIVLVFWLCILAAYGGRKIKTHSNVRPASGALRTVWPAIKLVPLPTDFLQGLDRQIYDSARGEFKNDNYLLGKSYEKGKWYYYPVAVSVKTPIIYLLLFAGALVLVLVKKPRREDEAVLLFFVAAYFLTACSFDSLQIGVRYLLPVCPACFLFFGKLGGFAFSADVKDISAGANRPEERLSAKRGGRRFLRAALILALLFMLVEHVMIWPHYLAYFNALAGGPENGHRVLRDSNLDWGQDLPALKKWMEKNDVQQIDLAYYGHDDPHRFNIRYGLPAAGSDNSYMAISVNFMTGKRYPLFYTGEQVNKSSPMWDEIEKYKGRRPVAMPGHSILVYNKVKSDHGQGPR